MWTLGYRYVQHPKNAIGHAHGRYNGKPFEGLFWQTCRLTLSSKQRSGRPKVVEQMRIGSSNIRDLPRPSFIDWLAEEADVVIKGAAVRCFKLNWSIDESRLDSWALHVRRHYMRDGELSSYVGYYGLSIDDYLQTSVIPDIPLIRSGDFAEIIVSDLLQFVEGYEVPRYKQHARKDKNASEHGADVIAYKLNNPDIPCSEDELLTVEVKSRCSSTDLKGGISEAAKDSPRDISRRAINLEYYSRCSLRDGDMRTAKEIRRFLDAGEHPFVSTFGMGIVAGVKDAKRHLAKFDAGSLCIEAGRAVFIVHGTKLMNLVNEVYDRCVQ